MLAFSGFLLYKLIDLLIAKKALTAKLVSILFAALYLVSPSYLETYQWISVSLEGSYAYSLMLLGIILYLLFFKSRNSFYFLGAFIVFLLSLKTAFGRSGFLIIILFLFEILNLTRIIYLKSAAIRIFALLVPVVVFLSNTRYFKNPATSSGSIPENLYLLFAYLPASIFPIEFLQQMYSQYGNLSISQLSFFQYNFNFLFGSILTAVFVIAIFLLRKTSQSKFMLFGFISILITTYFFINFGSLGKLSNIEVFDKSLTKYSIMPGHRYYQVSVIFFSLTLALMVASTRRQITYPVLFLGLIILTAYVSNIKTHTTTFAKDYGIRHRKFFEGVQKLVPDDGSKKILYMTGESTDGVSIQVQNSYFYGFYQPETIDFLRNKSDFTNHIQLGYVENHLYAFSFNHKKLIIINESEDIKNELRKKN
jgi:hypothetical protein